MDDERNLESEDRPADVEGGEDTEGHTMLPNMVFARQAAAQRERDIQRNVQRHQAELEARRPHRKGDKG